MPRWVYNPHTGGKSIPPVIRTRTERRILDYAAKHYSGKFTRIDVRFHGALCYIDAYLEPDVPCRVKVLHLPVRHALSGSKGCGIPHSPLPDSVLRKRRPVEFRLVHVCPRKVRTSLLDHWREPGHTGGSFRNSSPLSVMTLQAEAWCRFRYGAALDSVAYRHHEYAPSGDCSATGAGSVGPAPRRLARIYADTTHLINGRYTSLWIVSVDRDDDVVRDPCRWGESCPLGITVPPILLSAAPANWRSRVAAAALVALAPALENGVRLERRRREPGAWLSALQETIREARRAPRLP